LGRGILISLVTVFTFSRGLAYYPESLEFARTMGFTTLVVSQMIFVLECQSMKTGISIVKLVRNLHLIGAVLLSLLLFCAVIYLEPLSAIFETCTLSIENWLTIFVLSIIPTFVSVTWNYLKRFLTSRK